MFSSVKPAEYQPVQTQDEEEQQDMIGVPVRQAQPSGLATLCSCMVWTVVFIQFMVIGFMLRVPILTALGQSEAVAPCPSPQPSSSPVSVPVPVPVPVSTSSEDEQLEKQVKDLLDIYEPALNHEPESTNTFDRLTSLLTVVKQQALDTARSSTTDSNTSPSSPPPTDCPTPAKEQEGEQGGDATAGSQDSADISHVGTAPGGGPRVQCFHASEGHGVCWYPDGLCTDGVDTIIIDPTETREKGRKATSVYRFTHPYQQFEGRPGFSMVPAQMSSYRGQPAKDREIEWVDSLLTINGNTQMNIFHFATDIIGPINEAFRLVDSNAIKLKNKQISMITALNANPKEINSADPKQWVEHLLVAMFRAHGYAGEYMTPEKLFSHLGTTREEPRKWVCGREGMLGSLWAIPGGGRLESRQLRQSVTKYLNIPYFSNLNVVHKARNDKKLKPKVVLLERDRVRNYGRRFDNLEQMQEIMNKYNDVVDIETYIISNKTPFKEQIEMINDASVFIAAHGAGITMSMFLAEGATVVEIFPLKIFRTPYHRQASALGMNYLAVYSHFKGMTLTFHYNDAWKRDQEQTRADYEWCLSHSRIDASTGRGGNCHRELLHASTYTPPDEFELAFYNALSFSAISTPVKPGMRILESEGYITDESKIPRNKNGKKRMYYEFQREFIEPLMKAKGLDWDLDG